MKENDRHRFTDDKGMLMPLMAKKKLSMGRYEIRKEKPQNTDELLDKLQTMANKLAKDLPLEFYRGYLSAIVDVRHGRHQMKEGDKDE